VQQQPKGGFRRFVQTPAGKSILLAVAIALVFATFVYITPLLAIPVFLVVGLAVPIYAGLKRPRYLALAGLVVILLATPIASAAYTQEILTPTPAASSSASLPAGNGGAVLQNAYVTPFTGDTSTNFTWNVTIYPQYLTSTIEFFVPAGAYPYDLGAVPGYQTEPASGTATAGVSEINLTFSRAPYTVAFQETGLASGTNWSATFGGATANSTTSTVDFSVGNGTYSYTVGPVPGYATTRASGTVPISGTGATVDVSFTEDAYPVTFSETGLPVGAAWNVTVNGTTQTSTSPSLTIFLENGSYPYTFGSVTGFSDATLMGTVNVSGAAVPVSTAYSQSTQTAIFTETGLPVGTSWSVTVGTATLGSVGRSVSFPEGDGRFAFTVGSVSGYLQAPTSGNVTLSGVSKEVNVTFVPPEYLVSFTESGLLPAASWSVDLGGISESAVNSPVAVLLYLSTCPGAISGNSSVCPSGYPFIPLSVTLPTHLTAETTVTFRYTIGSDGIWDWQMALEMRDSAGHATLVSLVGDPTYDGIEGPVIGGFLTFFAEFLPTLYLDFVLYLGVPFYFVLLVYMVLKNREARRKEMRRRAAGPIPPTTAAGAVADAPAPSAPGPPSAAPAAAPEGSKSADEQPCPNCSALVYPGEKRCWKCGAELATGGNSPLRSGS
jgi:hypothetical protein